MNVEVDLQSKGSRTLSKDGLGVLKNVTYTQRAFFHTKGCNPNRTQHQLSSAGERVGEGYAADTARSRLLGSQDNFLAREA